ncbi:LOW QUALITY PROTEIN: hypothetical protein U9M48_035800 [Paspalum notatum var. saurae]|uniref:Retroviral polymerase SH3-like domain-containing protein n=1 Tax=Paspalum notatum var. saurae TaxID=547442 RepID=A0AAQ3UCA4_PASNO
MEFKDEAFGFVRDLVLRLRNESHKAMRAISSDNGGEFRNSRFKNFCRDLGLEHQFLLHIPHRRTVLWKARTAHLLRWHGRCSMSTGLRGAFGLRQLIQPVTLRTGSSCKLSFGKPRMNFGLVAQRQAFASVWLQKAGHLDKFESRCLDGIFLGYASSSRAFHVWILEAKQVVETCEVSLDETMPCTTPAFELSGDDEEGTPIFEDKKGAIDVGDAGAFAPAVAAAPSATSSYDDGGPLSMGSSSLPRRQAHAEAGPAEDVGEVTSEIVPSW